MSDTSNPLKLHHTILKAAARRGIYFIGTPEGNFRLGKTDDATVLSVEEFDRPADAFDAFDKGEVTFQSPKEEKTAPAGKCGVMSTGYHDRYSHNPHGPGSNDPLDCALRDNFCKPVGRGKTKVDVDALKATGEANKVWRTTWEVLNPGLQRMNLANRLRAWLRNNEGEIVLCDADGSGIVASRFGIEYRSKAKGKKAK